MSERPGTRRRFRPRGSRPLGFGALGTGGRVFRARNVHSRFCIACGYDGPEIQRRSGLWVYRCPGCGEDLYERPALSYAEREGLPRWTARSVSHATVHVLRGWKRLWSMGRPLIRSGRW